MGDSFLRHSPLAHLGLAGRATEAVAELEVGVLMGERPFRGLVNLRGPAGDQAFDKAVKTLRGITPEKSAQLRREARTMAQISHPNLSQVFGFEVWRGTPLLMVEFLDGGMLSDLLEGDRMGTSPS